MKQLLSAVVALACGVALADEPAKPVVTISTIFLTVKRRPLALFVR